MAQLPYGTEQPTDGETVTTPNPADSGSGGAAAVTSSRKLTSTPLGWGVVRPSRGDRLFRNLSAGSGVLIIMLITWRPTGLLAERGSERV